MSSLDTIHLGGCEDILPTIPDASVESVVSDPPYGLGAKEPNVQEIIEYLQGARLDTKGDFLGNQWDVPPVAVWRECFRILKPGGHLLVFAGTRMFDILSLGVRAAGFECRDTIASQFGPSAFQWVQAQGFAKSQNIAKTLRKKKEHEEADKHEGWGSALKPSWEPILVFRRPLSERTLADQALATGTGSINIDATRIGGPSGRWPANVVFTHADGCTQVGSKKVAARVINRFDDGMKPFGEGAGHKFTSISMGDADGMEEVPDFSCVEGCPVSELNRQSGNRPSTLTGRADSTISHEHPSQARPEAFFGNLKGGVGKVYADSGGASRFFAQFEADASFRYEKKPNKTEATLAGRIENDHPTKKPLALMRYLVRLVTPKGGTVLDPYCGSGTTCAAAIEEHMHFIGVEKDPNHHKTATERCKILLEDSPNSALDLVEMLSDED